MFVLPATRGRKPPGAASAGGKRRSPKISETAEHRTIAAYFRKIGLGGCAVALHIRNERAGHAARIEAARMGVTAGVPDWLIVDGGGCIFVELKPRGWKDRRAKSGAYTPHELRQLDMHKRLAYAGAVVAICETLDEVLETLRHYGVPLRTESTVTERVRAGLAAALASPEPSTGGVG